MVWVYSTRLCSCGARVLEHVQRAHDIGIHVAARVVALHVGRQRPGEVDDGVNILLRERGERLLAGDVGLHVAHQRRIAVEERYVGAPAGDDFPLIGRQKAGQMIYQVQAEGAPSTEDDDFLSHEVSFRMVASGLLLAVVDGLFEAVLRCVVDRHEHASEVFPE